MLYQEMKTLGEDKFYIELLENYPCNSKEELHQREGEYIRNMGTLNYQVSGRTRQEYREENREKEQLRHKVYYENNKEKELKRVKNYRENNVEKERERRKTYKGNHKEEIKQKRAEIVECECGALISKGSLKRHKGREIHQNRMKT